MAVDEDALRTAIGGMLGTKIIRTDCATTQLHGGTLGDVRLVTGTASTEGVDVPYRVVLKTQQRWQRPGDHRSWRREYDLYAGELGSHFTDEFRWPTCYHADFRNDRTELWLEYVEGSSGRDLSPEQLEQAASRLGRWQGRVHDQPDLRRRLDCLGAPEYLRRDFEHWRNQVTAALRRPDLPRIPARLKKLVRELDELQSAVLSDIERLPVVLCHRDFWSENIICSDAGVRVIDWDTAGWGYAGEDVASLIADETEAESVPDYFHRLVPAYLNGLCEHLDVTMITERHIRDLIMIKFGHRIVLGHLFAPSVREREAQLNLLQALSDLA